MGGARTILGMRVVNHEFSATFRRSLSISSAHAQHPSFKKRDRSTARVDFKPRLYRLTYLARNLQENGSANPGAGTAMHRPKIHGMGYLKGIPRGLCRRNARKTASTKKERERRAGGEDEEALPTCAVPGGSQWVIVTAGPVRRNSPARTQQIVRSKHAARRPPVLDQARLRGVGGDELQRGEQEGGAPGEEAPEPAEGLPEAPGQQAMRRLHGEGEWGSFYIPLENV